MNPTHDIRWHQRLQNFQRAFAELDEAVALSHARGLSKLEEQGLIQAFEYTYELAWNSIKDFYQNQGETGIQGSRDAIRLAFERGLIEDGEQWLAMIKSRTLTSHTYNRETARLIADQVLNCYHALLKALLASLEQQRDRD
ncbi:nucleotidyltransferase substrate binding protein [Pseudomonas sp. NW5]|uniref:nucleotidyltransferase substrate binding protein n=1 Tax=Pseudomonas sp. NW5 TaxID=2934934 RepID=UPI0020228E87|nr:nucleotidyltransferase substrate binding protein [Pseudomonas sp. NW5]MCL7462527.1 nucleotidyltransferase substrate binding protein [Pseudomonas sp. NW5]